MVLVLSNFFFIATSLFPKFIDAVCSGIIWRNKIFPAWVAAGVYTRRVHLETRTDLWKLRLKALGATLLLPFAFGALLVCFLSALAYLSFTQTAAKP
jgi:hypothetical protein